MRRFARLALGAIALSIAALSAAAAPPVAPADLVRAADEVAGPDGSRLEVLWVRPQGDGPFPLAVISHGLPRRLGREASWRPQMFDAVATEFARRGWAAAVVMRPGFGRSSGRFREGYGGCDDPDFAGAGQATADSFEMAAAALSRAPFVDASTILGVGQSAGGFGVLAFSTRAVPGLRAVVNFVGGRGSRAADEVCAQPQLTAAFATFGAASRVPSLWIYADGDTYFEPDLARSFHGAFTGAGGGLDVRVPARHPRRRPRRHPPQGRGGVARAARRLPARPRPADMGCAAGRARLPRPADAGGPPGARRRALAGLRPWRTVEGLRRQHVGRWPEDAVRQALDFCNAGKADERQCSVVAVDDVLQ